MTRFAYCSAGVQARLARLPDTAGGLRDEFLLGMVAERMAREGAGAVAVLEGAESADGKGGEGSSQLRPRRMRQAQSASTAPAKALEQEEVEEWDYGFSLFD